MVERQQNTVATLEESHIEKSALTKKNHEILRRNLLFTLGAEKKKVSPFKCKLLLLDVCIIPNLSVVRVQCGAVCVSPHQH
jgi:hypothetical protein